LKKLIKKKLDIGDDIDKIKRVSSMREKLIEFVNSDPKKFVASLKRIWVDKIELKNKKD